MQQSFMSGAVQDDIQLQLQLILSYYILNSLYVNPFRTPSKPL